MGPRPRCYSLSDPLQKEDTDATSSFSQSGCDGGSCRFVLRCGLVAGRRPDEKLPDREIRIGFAAHSIDLQALFGQLREGFKNHLSEAGLKYTLFEAAPDTSSNHAQMVQKLEDFATLQLDYVLVGPTSLDLNEPGP